MSSTYKRILPQVFPHVMMEDREVIDRLVIFLATHQGSFARTTDAPYGKHYLWLSGVSKAILEAHDPFNKARISTSYRSGE